MANEPNEQGTVRYVRCVSCGTPNPGTAENCSRCGKPMNANAAARPASPIPASATCPQCRKTLPLGSKFCGFCGSPLPAAHPVAVPKPPERPAESVPSAVAPPAQRIPLPQPRVPAPPPTPPSSPAPVHPPAPPVVAKPAPPPLPPQVSKPVTPVPMPPAHPHVSPPPAPLPRVPPPAAPVPLRPAVPSAASVTGGTVVFTGLHVPSVEASITEIKADGSAGKTLKITKETVIGSGAADLSYPQDPLLAAQHASVVVRQGKVFLRDMGSANGVFLKQRQDTELSPGDIFLMGRTLFRFKTQSLDDGMGGPPPPREPCSSPVRPSFKEVR